MRNARVVKSASAAKLPPKASVRRQHRRSAAAHPTRAENSPSRRPALRTSGASEGFARSILDGLSANIAVVDRSGTIVTVNQAWREFAAANGRRPARVGEGVNYLDVCDQAFGSDAQLARTFARNLRSLLAGRKAQFAMEYPCHSPSTRRWFVVQVSRLPGPGARHAIIAHENITARVQAETLLRESEEKHRLLLEDAGLGIGYYDTTGKLLLFNTTAARNMGGRPADFHGRSVHSLYGRALGATIAARIKKTLRSHTAHVYEDQVQLPTGDRWFLSSYSRVRNARGESSGVQIISADITARKLAEVALRESEERYRRLIEVSPDAIFVSRQGRIVLINNAGLKLFGATRPAQMLGRSPLDFTHPDYHALVRQRLHQQLTLGKPVPSMEKQIVRLDGTMRTVEVSAAPVLFDGVLSAQAVLRDVTERAQIADALRHSEASLAEAQTLAQIGSWRVVYQNGSQAWSCSQELRRIWGLPPGTPITLQTGLDRMHPDDRQRTAELWAAALRPGGPRQWEHRIIVHGKVKWISARVDVRRDKYGRVVEIAGMNQDITERREAEEVVRVQRAALAHLSRVVTMGELASGIAHEVNQPLGASLLYAETCRDLLKSEVFDKALLADALSRLVGQLERARLTVARLKKFVRKQPIARSTMDVNQVLQDSVDALHHELERGAIQLKLALSAVPAVVIGDHVLIQQVIMNLIINALDAMATIPAGDRILTLQTQVDAAAAVTVTVADTGSGVAADMTARLFDSFVTSKPDGMGLGLAISRSIVEHHGGKIWYQPAPQAGARFKFILPVTISTPTGETP